MGWRAHGARLRKARGLGAPVPVCPYAKMVPLYPSRVLSTMGRAVSSYTCAWVESESNTWPIEHTGVGKEVVCNTVVS